MVNDQDRQSIQLKQCVADRQKEHTEKSEVTNNEVAQDRNSNKAIILPLTVKATKLLHQQFSGDQLLIKYAKVLQKVKEMIGKKEELNYLKDQVLSSEDEEEDDVAKDKTIISADLAPSPSSDSNS